MRRWRVRYRRHPPVPITLISTFSPDSDLTDSSSSTSNFGTVRIRFRSIPVPIRLIPTDSDEADGSITYVEIFGTLDGATLSYAASTDEHEIGIRVGLLEVFVDVYDQITGGTVTIGVFGSDYTVAWSFDHLPIARR